MENRTQYQSLIFLYYLPKVVTATKEAVCQIELLCDKIRSSSIFSHPEYSGLNIECSFNN